MLEQIDHDDIREIRLARPPVNAIDAPMMLAIHAALQKAAADEVSGVVLSGRPGLFSAGLDIPSLLQLERDEIAEFWRSFFRVLQTLAAFPAPVFAAIGGHNPAGGTVLAIFCDRRIAARGDFRMGLNEVAVGLALPRLIFYAYRLLLGQREAERLAVVGEMISSADALACGLVDELVEPDDVVTTALDRLRGVLGVPRRAMLVTRRIARQPLMDIFDQLDEGMVEAITDGWFSAETQTVLGELVESLAKKKA
ncbi:MAG: enoyl-CoA hydratase/isomerase family protein [Proteobacteria bacterium]|nr:enoyl-CoA hydratase/isomerase family protein [Pseudomonadota bacterium]MCH8931239.1 enoyl-CoA hydratase/isomerase family protein [Pseudomonadota bacterium]